MKKLMSISIPVAFHRAGNEILNKMVSFQINQDGHAFIATPLINMEQRRLANLPEKMVFDCYGTTIISSRGSGERNMDVLKDILQEVSVKCLI